MTTTLPPSENFTGIFYNPAFWTTASSSLTLEDANALYLRKTTPDTATALETFSSGLSTQSMTAPDLAGDVLLFQNQTAGTLKLATAARSVHVSNIDCQGNAINTATVVTNSTLSIGSLQTGAAGILNLGTNALRTGPVNIGANNCTVNLGGHLTPTYTTMPNSTSEVGMKTVTTPSTGLSLGTSYTLMGPAVSIPIGVWLIQGSVTLPVTVVGTVVTITLNTALSLNQDAKSSGVVTTAGGVSVEVSLVVSQATATTWGLYGSATTASTTVTNPRFIYTRIA
jgi:hypothetical protein